jgi:thiol-disulfide isomerase/thioredoxin
MRKLTIILGSALLMATLFAACTLPATMPAETDTMAEDTMAEDAMEAMDLPAWQTLPLIDVRTGESFTLADYAGKALFVEPMATWCPNCRSQLGTVKTAVANANPDQAAFLALSVEAGLDASALAAYADQNEFGWRFAVATPEMLQALAETLA